MEQNQIVHFRDVDNNKLYVGDAIYRVEYNGLRFGVLGSVSNGGSIMTVTCYFDQHYMSSIAIHSLALTSQHTHRGHFISGKPDKILKVKHLSDFQKVMYKAALKKI